MNRGRFRHKIDIQQELTTQNSYGETTKEWVTIRTRVPASIEPLRGREYSSADMVQAEVKYRIRLDYLVGIKPKQRIKYCNRYFDIIDVIDINNRHIKLQLMCKESV